MEVGMVVYGGLEKWKLLCGDDEGFMGGATLLLRFFVLAASPFL
jgi:hypothetical protein